MSFSLGSYIKKYGTSYYRATLYFPPEVRKKIWQLYAFVRVPDLIVDDPHVSDADARTQLQELFHRWTLAYNDPSREDEIFTPAAHLFHEHNMDAGWAKSFFDAMLQDTYVKRYGTYEQLHQYMYGSAEVVGLMMSSLLGVKQEAYPYARKLGEAMQMTNFLRDIHEDYTQFGRIYLPEQDLARFGLGHQDIIASCQTKKIRPEFNAYMQYAIGNCDRLYEESKPGIAMLPDYAQKAVTVSAVLYQSILRKIQRNQYNVFARSAKTSSFDKVFSMVKEFGVWKGLVR